MGHTVLTEFEFIKIVWKIAIPGLGLRKRCRISDAASLMQNHSTLDPPQPKCAVIKSYCPSSSDQPGLQISAKIRLRKRSESEFFFESKSEAKRKRTPNFFLRSEANSLRFAIFRNPAKIAKIFFQLEFRKICTIFLEFMSLFMSRSSDQLLQYVPAWRSTKILSFVVNSPIVN